jgi:hypothetical protein
VAGFTKLFSTITESSIWSKPHYVVRIWIGMLARCDADGIVEASIPGFAHVCHVSVEEMKEAIRDFSEPDLDSRTKDNEGRRIEAFDGGWRILNYAKYREQAQAKEGSRAPYYRDYRRKQREAMFRADDAAGREREPGEEG